MARSVVTSGRLSKIEGVQEMLDKLSSLLDRTTAEQLKNTVFMDAGAALQHEIKVRAPKGWKEMHRKFPHLRDSVFLAKGRSNAPNVIVGVSHKVAPQGIWVEYGTEHSPAYPFFRPAIAASRDHVAYILITGIDAVIQGAVK